MNLIDYILLGVLFVSTLFGLYRGFIASVLGTGGCQVIIKATESMTVLQLK